MKFFLIIGLLSYFYLAQSKTIEHKDINSSIERLDTTDWDPLYYQYRIVNNVPYQYDKVKNEYFFNPIYGVFFLKQYQKKYNLTKNKKYIRYIDLMTKSLLKKSEYHHNARIFNYAPTGNVSRMYHKHYSGLTQSYYVEAYSNLYKIFENPYYKKLAIEFAKSIAIEKKDGGVLFHRENAYGIEEVPSEPNEWILNGWLSALVSLHRANEVLKDKALAALIHKNVDTLDRIIHLYDVPELANSRYSLTQFFYFRIRQPEYAIRKVTFTYPMDKKISLTAQPKSFAGLNGQKLSRWQPHFIWREGMLIDTRKDVVRGERIFQFNGILSRIAYPDLGTINVEYTYSLKNQKPEVDCYIGEYDPLSSAPAKGKWVNLPPQRSKFEIIC